jgi:hypothetical protein
MRYKEMERFTKMNKYMIIEAVFKREISPMFPTRGKIMEDY